MTNDEPISWDDYATDHDITEHEAPQAFAAFLHEFLDGRWDGDIARITDEEPRSAPPS